MKERNDVHPFSAGVTLDITRGLGAANVGDVKKWTPVLGAEYLYAIPLFDGDHPDKVSGDLRIRAGFGLKTRHANEKGYVQRSHLELVLSWQVNNLVVPGDDVYTAPVNKLYKHMLELRYYFQ
ncbi:MAG: hypothetical protein JNM00_12985 [Flavobacteriales bacterium]|nr:hypothetical protein [Flavobacteriales bacterium]